MRKFGILIALVGMMLGCFVGAGTAQAAPKPDVEAALVAAGVPAGVASQTLRATPAATGQVVNITHPNGGFPGSTVDAVINHDTKNVTVIQRWNSSASGLSVGWVNLSTGGSGISGFPDKLARPDLGGNYWDWATTLPTGPGPVALVVWGRVPSWTGLIPAAPEYFGILTPGGALLTV
ncbi:hypothetical protein [Jongsikchunia kroppenstedtii]|uniref:hypothetical protein n=1 Tax=Jongsikchunia kroppenstedtii TaxID=1121721 RepID=UPI0009DAD599|nr:hypothetical protein [Jongsikchunia kroppenstedtii]